MQSNSRNYRKNDCSERCADKYKRLTLTDTGMASVGYFSECRLENNAEYVIKCHYNTNEKRYKGKTCCRRAYVFALSLHEFKKNRELFDKLCAPTCNQCGFAEDLIEQGGDIRVINTPCD